MQEKEFAKLDFAECLAKVRAEGTADDYLGVPTAAEMEQVYAKGFIGASEQTVTFEERRIFRDFMAKMPTLYEIFPWARGLGKGRFVAPFVAILAFDPTFGGTEGQTRGSCVSHGERCSGECDYANDALHGETQWKGRLCTENIYRSRGYNRDGWYCQAAAHYVGPEGKGGFLFRDKYEGPSGEVVDLSTFSSKTENWAGNGSAGVPSWLEEISRKCKAQWIIPITTLEEYRDALALGFGINVCSGVGFSNETDQFGVSKRKGSWAHSMGHTACDDREWAYKRYGNCLGGIQQSWNEWNKQNGFPEGTVKMPKGMFYAVGGDIASMLKGGDSFACCGVRGWDRVTWEEFDISAMKDDLRSSEMQDYYKTRSERGLEASQRYAEEADKFLSA